MAGDDWAGAVGEGLSSFMAAYKDERKRQDDEKDRAKKDSFNQLIAGVRLNPNGQYEYTPEKQQEVTLGKLKTQNEMEEFDKTSPHAGLLRNIAIQQVKTTHPEYSEDQVNSIVPQGLNAVQYKEAAGLLKPEISGYFGMKGKEAIAGAIGGRNATAKDSQTITAAGKITNDSQLNTLSQRIIGVRTIKDQIAAVKRGEIVDTKQLLGDINAEYLKLVTNSSSPALGKLERTEYTSTASDLAGIIQKITGNPQSINSPDIMNQLEKQIDHADRIYRKSYAQRAPSKKVNLVSNPNANAEQDRVIKDLTDQFGPEAVAPNAALSPEDQEAINWAKKANPKDPRAIKILKLHGM